MFTMLKKLLASHRLLVLGVTSALVLGGAVATYAITAEPAPSTSTSAGDSLTGVVPRDEFPSTTESDGPRATQTPGTPTAAPAAKPKTKQPKPTAPSIPSQTKTKTAKPKSPTRTTPKAAAKPKTTAKPKATAKPKVTPKPKATSAPAPKPTTAPPASVTLTGCVPINDGAGTQVNFRINNGGGKSRKVTMTVPGMTYTLTVPAGISTSGSNFPKVPYEGAGSCSVRLLS